MNKHQLTPRQKEHLTESIDQFIDTLTSEMYVFVVITYDHKVRFDKRPFSDNYLDVYNDNRMFKRLIDHSFYRNPSRSPISYLFTVERHRNTPRLHINLLMSHPNVEFVRYKYEWMLTNFPFDTVKSVLERSIRRIHRFTRDQYKIQSTTDVCNLKSYVTKEIRYFSNTDCIDFQNSTFSRIPNTTKTTPIYDDSKLDTVTDDRPIERQ